MEEIKKEEISSEVKIEKEEKIKMPWQGKVWIFINSFFISTLFLSLFLGFFFTKTFILLNDFFIKFYNFRWDAFVLMVYYPIFSVGGVFSDNDDFIVLMFSFFIILHFFMIVGFFKGWKWEIIFSIIYSIMIILFLIFNFFVKTGTLRAFIILFSLHIFTLYIDFSCFKHPFYNQKKIK